MSHRSEGKLRWTESIRSSPPPADGEWLASQPILAYGVRIGIRTNKPRFLKRILDHAPPLWKPAGGAFVERQFSFRVGRLAPEGALAHSLLDDCEAGTESNNLDEILDTFERRVKMHVAEMAPRRVFIHAAAVAWHGKAIIVPGRTMSGKTSLAAELVRAGATYYSDEYAVLDRHGRVHPYPSPLAIRREGSNKQERRPVDQIGGEAGTRPLTVGLVVVTRYKAGASWRPVQLSPGPAALELLANTIPARRRPEVVIPTLQRVVVDASCLKGVRGEARKTARRILERMLPE